MIKQYKKIVSSQCGFSLIEALVAFLILSIGMLGIASLQLLSLKAGHTASLRTVAVIKIEEMFERIRNNPTVLDPAVAGTYVVDDVGTGSDNSCNDYATLTICNKADLASDDIYRWKTDLENSMPPDTTASIAVVGKTPGTLPVATVTITVNWLERNQEAQTLDTMSHSVSAYICDNTTC